MNMSVVLPYFNRWDLTHVRLMELYKHLPQDVSIVLVNDASTEKDCSDGAAWWQKGVMKDRLFYYQNKENKGFGISMNNGVKVAIKWAKADIVVLLSNDVRVLQNFSVTVKTIIGLDKNVLIGRHVFYHDTGWNVLPDCGVVPYANGWFLACHVDVFRDLHGFDPIYGRFDYEDIDLSTKAWMQGIKLVSIDTKLVHESGQTISKLKTNRLQQTLRNKELWINKWQPYAKELKAKIYG